MSKRICDRHSKFRCSDCQYIKELEDENEKLRELLSRSHEYCKDSKFYEYEILSKEIEKVLKQENKE